MRLVGSKNLVGNPWEMQITTMTKKPINLVFTGIPRMRFQDEARHGKAFEGLLKRYFG